MTMNFEKFTYLLDLHGADFTRWPDDEAAAARSFAQSSEDARQALARAARLDDFLNEYKTGPMPDTVLARTMQALDRPAYINDNRRDAAARWRVGGWALAACAALVMLVQAAGTMRGTGAVNGEAAQPVAITADAQAEAEVELFVLAMADPLLDTLTAQALAAPLGASAGLEAATVDLFVDQMLETEMDGAGIIR